MIALRRAIFMKADPVVSLDANRLLSGRACSCKKDPAGKNYVRVSVLLQRWAVRLKVPKYSRITMAASY